MPYAVVFYLDTQASEPIRQTIRELAEKNIAPYMYARSIPPHVTLAIYEDMDCRTCEEKIAKLASQTATINLNFSFLGFFHTESTVIFLGLTPTRRLISIHQQVHQSLAENGTKPWELYLPGKWVPHCSLAVDFPSENTDQATALCMRIALPLSIPVTSLGVVRFEPVQPLYHYAILED